jgi:transposase
MNRISYTKQSDAPVNIEERDREIYIMHKGGLTYRRIAKLFNISSSKAFNIVCRIDYERLANARRQTTPSTRQAGAQSGNLRAS